MNIARTVKKITIWIFAPLAHPYRQGEEFEVKIAPPSLLLYMEAKPETVMERLIKSGPDDTEETIIDRAERMEKTFEPILAFYESRGIVRKINSEIPAKEVFGHIAKAIEEMHRN